MQRCSMCHRTQISLCTDHRVALAVVCTSCKPDVLQLGKRLLSVEAIQQNRLNSLQVLATRRSQFDVAPIIVTSLQTMSLQSLLATGSCIRVSKAMKCEGTKVMPCRQHFHSIKSREARCLKPHSKQTLIAHVSPGSLCRATSTVRSVQWPDLLPHSAAVAVMLKSISSPPSRPLSSTLPPAARPDSVQLGLLLQKQEPRQMLIRFRGFAFV